MWPPQASTAALIWAAWIVHLASLLPVVVSNEPKIPRACKPPQDHYRFCDTSLSYADRVDSLIDLLTVKEKASLLIARNSPLGSIPRLGIPEYDWGGNCLHGVQARCIGRHCPTSFPMPNALGNSFNRSVWKNMGQVIGQELRALWLHGGTENHPTIHNETYPHIGLDCWSPNVEIVRDPRWGRNAETPSEDPLICGEFGKQVTGGIQNGEDGRYLRAIATLKHFVGNSVEGKWKNSSSGNSTFIDRHNLDARISDYDLHSTYLRPFELSIRGEGAEGVMCSYNRVNGVPACANSLLLQDVLRDKWGFEGYVVTDSGAIDDFLPNHHNWVRNWTEAVAKAVTGGCDMESATWKGNEAWATGGPFQEEIPKLVQAGMLVEKEVDDILHRVLLLRFRLGLFDPIEGQPYWHVPIGVIGNERHKEFARDATSQSLVLLQNRNGTLPFQAGHSVAVIGPHCIDRFSILGSYLGQMCPDKFGSTSCVKNVFEAVRNVNDVYGGTTKWKRGCDASKTRSEADMNQAIDLAANAEHVIFVGGIDRKIEAEGVDRHEISLPAPQIELLHKVCEVNKKTVVVLFHGGIVTVDNTTLSTCSTIISAGYPGFFGAESLAKAMFDTPDVQATNRWGRLAVTWYSQAGWQEANFDMLDFQMTKGRTHRYYTGTPQFAFGHGLTYVPLEQIAIHIKAASGEAGKVTVGLTIANNSTRAVDDVVLLYARPESGVVPCEEPASLLNRELIDFERVSLLPQSTFSLSSIFTFGAKEIMLHDSMGSQVLFEGGYTVIIESNFGAWEFSILCSEMRCELASDTRSVVQ